MSMKEQYKVFQILALEVTTKPYQILALEHHLLLLHHLIMSEDVLIQIFLCLPVISLLRFKSVCKSWRSIIESPFFIHLHAITTKSGGTSLFLKQGDDHDEEEEKIGDEHQEMEKICRLSGEKFEVFEDLGRPPLIDLDEKELEELKYTADRGRVRFSVVGCSNGIICLHDGYTRNIVLWNPAIKQSRLLPKPSNLLGNPNCSYDYVNNNCGEDVVAFGVDFKTKDYKVLLITTLEPLETYFGTPHSDQQQMLMHSHSPRPRRVHVYNLSTHSWRCIDTTLSDAHPYLLIDRSATVRQGVHLNGSHFFMTSCLIKVQDYFCTRPLILSLDLTEEIFKTIPPPYDWWNKISRNCGTGWNYFIPFGEKLALVEGFKRKRNVWVLNEEQHGVKESWTKLYTLRHPYRSPIELQSIANKGEFAIIYWIDHSNYLHAKEKFRILNLITGETKDVKSCPLQLVNCGFGIYRPSLVQISRSGATANEKCNAGTLKIEYPC